MHCLRTHNHAEVIHKHAHVIIDIQRETQKNPPGSSLRHPATGRRRGIGQTPAPFGRLPKHTKHTSCTRCMLPHPACPKHTEHSQGRRHTPNTHLEPDACHLILHSETPPSIHKVADTQQTHILHPMHVTSSCIQKPHQTFKRSHTHTKHTSCIRCMSPHPAFRNPTKHSQGRTHTYQTHILHPCMSPHSAVTNPTKRISLSKAPDPHSTHILHLMHVTSS